jgi:hypothetical protein
MKEKLCWLCTCTAIELMTAIGVTFYLVHLAEFTLALISLVIFSKLIVFHYVIDFFDKKKSKNITLKIHS